jgi:hypothetical protein
MAKLPSLPACAFGNRVAMSALMTSMRISSPVYVLLPRPAAFC